jgi:hypothetical protein
MTPLLRMLAELEHRMDRAEAAQASRSDRPSRATA